MIFIAVGSQLPFDRLIRYIDEWAKNTDQKIIAQIGDATYMPKNMEYKKFINNDEFNQLIHDASVFISHAGMGNIFSAKEQKTPIIVLNRQYKLNEIRNNHQADGLAWMAEIDGVYTASTKEELIQCLERTDLDIKNNKEQQNTIGLSEFIADFIQNSHLL